MQGSFLWAVLATDKNAHVPTITVKPCEILINWNSLPLSSTVHITNYLVGGGLYY